MQVRLNGKQLKKGFRLNSFHRKMKVENASVSLVIRLDEDEYYKLFQLFDNLIGVDNFDVIIKSRGD